MAGAEVGKQGGGGNRVLAARGGADPEVVGGVIEEEIHGWIARWMTDSYTTWAGTRAWADRWMDILSSTRTGR
jgi:hypothetical protein